MFIDARTLSENTTIETDVCIVGAGAAGITLAREFVGRPFQVALLESGGLEFDSDTQSLYKGKNIGHPYFPLDEARLRFFGGTTNHWSGYCVPFRDLDFETRDWIPHSGWPFRKSNLDPFYQRAQSICQLGPFAYDAKTWETENDRRLPFVGDSVITMVGQFSPPTRFGQVYRDEITRVGNINTYLYANVTYIETIDTARIVTRLRVASLTGNKFWVKAKLFILATGGIENARLLLLSNQTQSAGLGNQNDLVGRFFMEHLYEFSIGIFLPSDSDILKLDFYQASWRRLGKGTTGKTRVVAYCTLSSEAQRREQLLHTGLFIHRFVGYPAQASKGYKSLQSLVRPILRGEVPDDFWRHLGNVITDIDEVAVGAYWRMFKRNHPVRLFHVGIMMEQAPNPASRVTLSAERDRLGKNRVHLDWRWSPLDMRTLRRVPEVIGVELGRAGLGRLKVTLDNDDATLSASVRGLYHHMGTTRMHADPKKGVVDETCRVHGMANLFIAGSSIFPTGGHSSPTLTIVALALRLADHVKRLMS